MIIRRELTDAQALAAMREGEFPAEVIAAEECVAVIMSQDWCHQWTQMDDWLHDMESRGEPEETKIAVFHLLYNLKEYFDAFMSFKETIFGNDIVPYVRYYLKGRFLENSNYVTAREFLDRFAGKAGSGL